MIISYCLKIKNDERRITKNRMYGNVLEAVVGKRIEAEAKV